MLLAATLERALRHYLQLDPNTLTRLALLSGKVAKIELTGWHTNFYLLPDANGIRLQNYYEGPVNATIKGSPISLLRTSLARDEKVAQMAQEINITGDIELAHTLSHILQQIEIDWEEPLALMTGDVIAHQIGNGVRNIKRLGKTTLHSLRRNLTDYLQEESRQLPPRQEVEDFFADIHTLRNDIARFEANLQAVKL